MENLTERQFTVLLKEYELLQARIKDYDARIFQVKGWSTTIFSAALGLSIVQKNPLLLLVPGFACVVFWGLDALFKSFQHILIDRTSEVEEIFNSKSQCTTVGSISLSFETRDTSLTGRVKRVGRNLFRFNVMVLYVGKLTIIAIAGGSLAFGNA